MRSNKIIQDYALVLIGKINDDLTIDGNWVQNCVACTLEEAIERARATEKVNSYRISIAVVDAYLFGVTGYSYKTGLVRYDIQKQNCDYCNTEITWNYPSVKKGEIYGCETCGKAFCGTCFKEITQQDKLPGFWDKFECPDCWKLNNNKIKF